MVGFVGAQWAWAGVVGVAAPIIAATIVLTGVLATMRQKERTDRKDQWWKRVQWSAELVLGPDEQRRTLGLAALTALIEGIDEINASDADLLTAIINQVDISDQLGHRFEDGHDRLGSAADGGTGSRGEGTAGAGSEAAQDVA